MNVEQRPIPVASDIIERNDAQLGATREDHRSYADSGLFVIKIKLIVHLIELYSETLFHEINQLSRYIFPLDLFKLFCTSQRALYLFKGDKRTYLFVHPLIGILHGLDMKNKCLWCVFVELINFSKETPCVKVLT